MISAPEESNYVASVEIKSSKAPEVSVQEVLLGVAAFDLSDFLRGSWEVRLAGSLVHPRSIYCPNLGDKNDEKFSIFGKDSPLTSDSLMSFGTSVKIKARLACDLRTVYENVLLRDDILNRIFMILNNLNLACDILDEVSSHNSHLSVTRGSSNENFEAEVKFPCNKSTLTFIFRKVSFYNYIVSNSFTKKMALFYFYKNGIFCSLQKMVLLFFYENDTFCFFTNKILYFLFFYKKKRF